MEKKSAAAVLYILATFGMAQLLDAAYGAGPIIYHVGLIWLGIVGTVFFAFASVMTFLNRRVGIACGSVACGLCLPWIGRILLHFPYRELPSILRYANWGPAFVASVIVAVSTAYSFWQAWLLFR